jgi:beta-lactam-binding protein with PASTA domain
MAERLDGKFDIARELERTDAWRRVEAVDANGRTVRVDWFFVTDPKSRSGFHRYRTAVKNAGSALLLDAVARPGAYYTVWEPLDGVDAQAWLEGHPKDERFKKALTELGDVLESYGFALQDARILALQGEKEVTPALAALEPADRTSDEIKALNAALLAPARGSRATRTLTKTQKAPARAPAPPVGRINAKPVPVKTAPLATTPNQPASSSKIKVVQPRRRLTIWGVLPGILLLVVAGWFGTQVLARFLEPPTVEVPNVQGKNLQDALKIISDARLTPRPTEGSDQTQVKGIILSQNPPAGTNLTEQRVVEITVNRPRPLIMPDLNGKSVGEAKLALTEAGLVIGRTAVVPAPQGVAPSTIIGQSPPAQTEVVKGQGITVLVSGSRAPAGKTFIPDLSGLGFDDAKLIISAAGLRLVEVRTKSSNLPSGIVLSQTPKAYSSVNLDSEAVITVSATQTARNPVIPRPVQPPPPPPPVVAPQPVAPPQPEPPVDPNAGVEPGGANNLPPVTNPENPQPPETQPENPPTNNAQSIINAAKPCPVTFSYTVPADLGTVTVEIRVRDEDGERVALPATPLSSGTPWEYKDTVRGRATFTVFVDGISREVAERDPPPC